MKTAFELMEFTELECESIFGVRRPDFEKQIEIVKDVDLTIIGPADVSNSLEKAGNVFISVYLQSYVSKYKVRLKDAREKDDKRRVSLLERQLEKYEKMLAEEIAYNQVRRSIHLESYEDVNKKHNDNWVQIWKSLRSRFGGERDTAPLRGSLY